MLELGEFNFTQYIDNISKSIIVRALELNNGNIKKTAAAAPGQLPFPALSDRKIQSEIPFLIRFAAPDP